MGNNYIGKYGIDMSRKRRTSLFEALIGFATSLPYWISLAFAVISYLILSRYAAQPIEPVIRSGSAMPTNMFGIAFQPLLIAAQFLIPIAFIIGAMVSGFKSLSARNLSEKYNVWEAPSKSVPQPYSSMNKPKPTDDMNWQQFELLVGEAFNKQGYRVIHGGDAGADGGVDVHLRKEGKEYLVQCKHWKTRKVGVAVIRELYGVMAAVGAAGGFIVTSGEFTEEAEAFSEGKTLTLISGDELSRMLGRTVQGSSEGADVEKVNPAIIHCPKCSSPMVKRVAKRGPNAGNEFMGCSRYPKCRGIVNKATKA